MKTIPLIAMLLLFSMNAFSAPVVLSEPGNPLADVMGNVLSLEGSDEYDPASCLDSPLNPPCQSGWPVDINNFTGDEGGLLVNADADPDMEVLFLTGKIVHLMDTDGTELPGWPVTIPTGTATCGQPAFGDLDGDGTGEVVVLSHNYPNGSMGWVYAYHTDGTLVSGFPATTNGDQTKSPTVVDLYNDGTCDIIVSERDYPIGRIYVFDGSGQTLSGWPVDLDHVPAASAGAADIDNDGEREVVFESYLSIYALNPDGTAVPGFPYTPSTGDNFSYSAPVFADVDGDGYLEIAAGGHALSGSSHMFLLNHDGTDVAGWPKAVPYWIYAPATFADMDGDGDLEIMAGDQVLSPTPTDHMYAWNADGSTVSGWPVGPIEAVNTQVAVADVDGDGNPEFFWDTNVTPGKLMGYHHDGSPISGWPITTDGSCFFNTPALGDVDGDGDIELLELTYIDTPLVTAYLWDLPDQVDPMDVQMPMFQYGPGRDGLIYDPSQQGIGSGEAPAVPGSISAFPNPFSASVTVRVHMTEGSPGSLRIMDLSGRVLREIQPVTADGYATYVWSPGDDLPAGIYHAGLVGGSSVSGLELVKL